MYEKSAENCDRRTETRTDGHHHTIIRPVWRQAYKNPIPLQQICVLSYLCLLLTKVLFGTSFKSFQYNTEGRRLSNYSIKLILCSHYRSSCKGLCQNKKHEFDQYTKGGHFCAAHMALRTHEFQFFLFISMLCFSLYLHLMLSFLVSVCNGFLFKSLLYFHSYLCCSSYFRGFFLQFDSPEVWPWEGWGILHSFYHLPRADLLFLGYLKSL